MDDNILAIILSLSICVALPIVITWLVLNSKNKKMNRKYDLLSKALEHGVELNPKLLLDPQEQHAAMNTKMRLINKLQRGVIFIIVGIATIVFTIVMSYLDDELGAIVATIFLSLGIGYLVAYIVGIKKLQPEIEAEEKALKGQGGIKE